MSEITGISGVDSKNSYSSTSTKKTDSSSEFSSYLGETKTMDAIFDEASEKYNVPVDLLKAVGKTESNFNADAVSRCGAQGVMQLMPATAKELGVTDSFDAEQNIMAGAKYLSGLFKKYDGDTKLTLAAYNAGSGNVAKYNGVPPFEETQNYVKKVMKFMGQGNIEIAEVDNTITTKTAATDRLITTAKTTPISRNLGYLLTNDTSSTNSASGANSELTDLNEVYNYDDYMQFLELFLDSTDKESTDKESDNSIKSYNTNEINYNVSVMNLLKNQNLF